MPGYLLDTNHVGMAVDRTSVVGERIFEARLAGVRLGTCLPVLCDRNQAGASLQIKGNQQN
jgi:hypothetical protein